MRRGKISGGTGALSNDAKFLNDPLPKIYFRAYASFVRGRIQSSVTGLKRRLPRSRLYEKGGIVKLTGSA